MATHSCTLAWKIPWMEEPGGLQSMGSLRVRHDWATSFSLFTFHFSLSCIGEGNGNPLQCSCLENPRDGGGWWAAVYGVAQSRTRLKRLSSSSSSSSCSIFIKTHKVIKSLNLFLPIKKTLSQDNFTKKFYKILKKKKILYKIFQKIKDGVFLNSFYEATITLMQNETEV